MKKKFDANYDFVSNEISILELWEKEKFFDRLLEKNADGKKFRFIDGPITANGAMGVHHLWGRSLKDTFLRYKALRGYTSHYRNGFDGQGLWVEVEVEKDLGFNSKQDIERYGLDNFTNKCIERVKNASEKITEQSKRLGMWMDWPNSYNTNTDENITSIWAMLKKCHEQGWIRQVYKPMPWCTRCGTSLSEHEMSGSHIDVTHEAVIVKLPLKQLDASILVWTTTPWTLSSNVALAVNSDMEYIKFTYEGESAPLICSSHFYKTTFAGDAKAHFAAKLTGRELEGLVYETCFPTFEKQAVVEHRVVLWDEVVEGEGTGVVHIAPGCGPEDFELGKQKGLATIVPIDELGNFTEGLGFLTGKNVKACNELIFEELRNSGKLFHTHDYEHSYPVCWRCKQEIVFVLVKDWVISVDELRDKLIENAKKVIWNPDYAGKRMQDWLQNMSDWSVSRKRYFGLPLPFYVCGDCGELTVIGSYEELAERTINKEELASIPHLHRPWIDRLHIKCPKCGSSVNRIPEVGDVWLDAGIVPFSTLKYFTDREYWAQYFPAEYIVEMKEQVRLWYYAMLFMSTVLVGVSPYEQAGTHGMITDENGKRFSKTRYMISFDDVATRMGADAARYIFASTSPMADVRFGFKLGEECKRKLMSLLNICSFFALYAEVDGFSAEACEVSYESMGLTDRWLMIIVNEFVQTAQKTFDNYQVSHIVQSFEKLLNDISNFYIRVNRKRFWKEGADALKDSAYAALFHCIKVITQVMSPIIPFLTEYIWQELVRRHSTSCPPSVHLSDWPEYRTDIARDQSLLDSVELARRIISLALKARNEEQIRVKQPLEALFVVRSDTTHLLSDDLKAIIAAEINVRDIVLIDSLREVQDDMARLELRNAGRVLKGDVDRVKSIVDQLGEDDMQRVAASVRDGQSVTLPGVADALAPELFFLVPKPKRNIAIAGADEDCTVALNTLITEDLHRDGMVRDMIRQCQVLRKDLGLDISDRILIRFNTNAPQIEEAIDCKSEFIEKELLAKIVEDAGVPDAEMHTLRIKGLADEYSVRVQITKAP